MRPARLRQSTSVFLVGNIEDTMDWYRQQFDVEDLNGRRLVFAQPTPDRSST